MQKSEMTCDSILQGYIKLLDSTHFDKVTVRALCGEVGIVRSTFYTYFSDIYEVIQTIEDNLISAFMRVDQADCIEPEFDQRLRTEWGFPIEPSPGFYRWFDCCLENWDALRAMIGPHGDPYFVQKFRRTLTDHVTHLMHADRMPDDELRRGYTESMVEVHFILVRNWMLHENTSLNAARIAVILNSMRVGGNTLGHYRVVSPED